MQHLNGSAAAWAPALGFFVLALFGGAVTALSLAGHLAGRVSALNIGAAVFLGQFVAFIALAGLGLPPTVAQGMALTLGAAAAWARPA